MSKKRIFDLHCDLPTKIYNENKHILSSDCAWSTEKADYGCFVQFFAAYIDKSCVDNPFEYTTNVLSAFKKELSATPGILHAESFRQIESNMEKGIHSAVLTIEGGEALGDNLSRISYFRSLGVRLMTLTWNYENALGYSAFSGTDTQKYPLKPFGIQAIAEMEKNGIIIDVSHLNEGGFWSVAEHSTKPFFASHSNAKGICRHVRNLNDDQIACIIQNKGLIGINLYPPHLTEKPEAGVLDVLKQIDYFLSRGATDHIALGCDFDGMDIVSKDLQDVSVIPRLIEEMLKHHYSDELIEKIIHKNCENVLKKLLV